VKVRRKVLMQSSAAIKNMSLIVSR